MSAMLLLMLPAFVACVVIGALHCYMGLHVIRRGVIFVDLALAQMAALGSAVGLLIAPTVLGGHDEGFAFESASAFEASLEPGGGVAAVEDDRAGGLAGGFEKIGVTLFSSCLLYTSGAADDLPSCDICGRVFS